MRRTGTLLMALALTATGCVELPTWTNQASQHPAKAPPLVAVEAPPVRADQVNDANAPHMLNALRDELDRAGDERPAVADKMP